MTDPFEQNNPPMRPIGNQEPHSCDGCNTFKRLLTNEREQTEQLRVQLAGCGVAALGYNDKPAIKSDYGWSQSYQDTLELRQRYDLLSDRYRRDVKLGEEAACLLQLVCATHEFDTEFGQTLYKIREFLKRKGVNA